VLQDRANTDRKLLPTDTHNDQGKIDSAKLSDTMRAVAVQQVYAPTKKIAPVPSFLGSMNVIFSRLTTWARTEVALLQKLEMEYTLCEATHAEARATMQDTELVIYAK
jgi:hypothetical protein